MTSRLDRLVLLLDTGSPVVRNTAADQLADIQKAHPHELYNLLGRVVPFLHYPSWDTRVAAARAIGGIVEHVKQWDPNEDEEEAIRVKLELSENPTATDQMEALDQAPDTPQAEDRFAFASFDITNVIKKGQPLLGSAGKEYDLHLEGLSAEARLLHAKQNVTARLGLGAEFMDADLLTAQDLALQTKQKSAPASPRMPIDPTGAAIAPQSEAKNEVEEALSARQRNMLKRKARMAGKGGSNKVRVIDVSGTPSTATPKQESESAAYFSVTEQALNDAKVVVEHKLAADPAAAIRSATEPNAWPLDALAEILTVDLFDTKWERRHGASMALREILRAQAPGAGRRLRSSRPQNDDANRAYLDDVACRICCVFALDRFGDYVADQVVAPIRESVSQTLAALLKHLAAASVASTFGLLCQLIYQEDLARPIWEVTHGGMLGLKYLVAMRKDVLLAEDTLLDQLISVVFAGLGHTDDDVRAVAAATLIPIAEELISKRPAVIDTLLTVLWDCLADMRDDLSASTGSVMDLLAQLCSFEAVIRSMRSTAESDEERTFAKLIPRLYAFFRHTITTVRSAVLRAMRVLVLADEDHRVDWINDHLLRLVFQNLLVEQSPDVLALSFDFWTLCLSECQAQSCPLIAYYPSLLKLVMTPVGHGRQRFALDRTLFVRPSGRSYTVPTKSNHGQGGVSKRGKKPIEVRAEDAPHDIDGPTLDGDVELVGFGAVIQNRCFAARGLGRLLSHWPVEAAESTIAQALPQYLQSRASSPCYLSAILMQEVLEQTTAASLKQRVRHLSEPVLVLETSLFYSNFASSLHALRAQCQNLINVFGEVGRVPRDSLPRLPALPVDDATTPAFGLGDATDLLGQHYDRLKRLMQSSFKGQIAKTVELAHSAADQALTQASSLHLMEGTRIAAAVSGALIRSGDLPKKLNPIIKALMESVKTEPEHVLQKRSAQNLAVLVHFCHESGRTAALDKLIKNLCAFLCIDADRTPEFGRHSKLTTTVYSVSVKRDTDIPGTHSTGLSESQSMRIKRMGAQMALEEMLLRFGSRIFAVVPKLQQCIHGPLEKVFGSSTALPLADTDVSLGQEVIDALCIFRDLMKSFDPAIHEELLRYADLILRALQSDYSSVRFAAAGCLAAICSVMTIPGMQLVIERVLPLISNSGNLRERQGAIETVHLVVQLMDVRILPYVIFLIVPVLGRMSDSDNDIRELATRTFAQLVKLVPLEAGIPDPPGMPEALLAERDNERRFIQQMLDGSKVEAFRIPVAIKADLRSYQQDGVNWLAFLNRYQLHGILCDDMGLGKTLQTICIVASDHHNRQVQYQESGSGEWSAIPSLVVCPPTLTGHWEHELNVYAPFLNVVGYVGPRDERLKIQSSLSTADVVVTSYDIVRNDVDFLSRQSWNYCVLDEGHIIKNSKAKLTQAVKLMRAGHRLILSGTPIQNNVLELWSLFDFLMPGFLGTEKSFYARYAKPIANSREAKSSSKDHEAGVLALEALHKQVLPFLLRRLKEDVLSDLPPKIIQDYYCDLSPLQQTLYNTFTASQAQTVASETIGSVDKSAKSHVFQALQYMRKLCNHPSLVLTEKHPDFARITKSLHAQNTTLNDVKHGPKLLALRDLLVDCGLGSQQDNVSPLDSSVVNQHRALIFCQMKDMLDLVEVEVLKKLLPSISYMRLDGSTDPRNRQAAVQKFNADPSIDVLLLTTHVGGLGLNLTGADTVIFVEHDWNPMKDLQAMDRAHRLGQKKTVNVYRLITKDTLEEKIMGLQRFKLNIASSVVNQQNTGLATMDTDQILDLFNAGSSTAQQVVAADETGLDSQGNLLADGSKALFDDLQELHAQSEYADFNDLSAFVSTL